MEPEKRICPGGVPRREPGPEQESKSGVIPAQSRCCNPGMDRGKPERLPRCPITSVREGAGL